MLEILKNVILSNLGPQKPAPNNWLKSNCKLCHLNNQGVDKRHRFGIQITSDKILVHCFNCGFSASYTEGKSLTSSFKKFLIHIDVDIKFISHLEFEIFKNKNNLSETKDGAKESYIKSWKPYSLPDDSLTLKEWLEYSIDDSNFINVANYAISRKLYNFENLYWTPSSSFNLCNRLIIPYYFNTKIVGFTSRLCYPDKDIPKYYQQCPSDFVYNLDNQHSFSRKTVIITEGVIDALVIDGVATLGEINKNKIDLINKLQKRIIVCPDRDTKGEHLVKAAIDNNWEVSFPKWELQIKDVADAVVKYGRILALHSILESAISNREKIIVNWKMLQHDRKIKHITKGNT